MSRSMAESQVKQMAAWQGPLWGSARLVSGDLAEVVPFYEWQANVNVVSPFEQNCLTGLDRIRDICPPELYARRDSIWAAHMRSLELSTRGPITLIHGDTHLGNWYVTAEGEMGISDWHVMSKGRWALDFTYALMSALTVENRRAWERELLELYLDSLRSYDVDAPSFDEAWLEYRQQAFHGLFFWLVTIGSGRFQPKMQPDEISRANLERMVHAVQDLKSFAALDEHAGLAS
jgi:hypothetical protein